MPAKDVPFSSTVAVWSYVGGIASVFVPGFVLGPLASLKVVAVTILLLLDQCIQFERFSFFNK